MHIQCWIRFLERAYDVDRRTADGPGIAWHLEWRGDKVIITRESCQIKRAYNNSLGGTRTQSHTHVTAIYGDHDGRPLAIASARVRAADTRTQIDVACSTRVLHVLV